MKKYTHRDTANNSRSARNQKWNNEEWNGFHRVYCILHRVHWKKVDESDESWWKKRENNKWNIHDNTSDFHYYHRHRCKCVHRFFLVSSFYGIFIVGLKTEIWINWVYQKNSRKNTNHNTSVISLLLNRFSIVWPVFR